MVVVEIRAPVYDEEAGRADWVACAMVFANGAAEVSIVDAHGVLNTAIPVVDAVTGRQVRFADDAERWARNLPSAFRAGDLVAVVLADAERPGQSSAAAPAEIPSVPAPPPLTRPGGRVGAGRSG